MKLAVSKGNNTIETVENTKNTDKLWKGRSFLPLLSQQSGKASYNTYTRQQVKHVCLTFQKRVRGKWEAIKAAKTINKSGLIKTLIQKEHKKAFNVFSKYPSKFIVSVNMAIKIMELQWFLPGHQSLNCRFRTKSLVLWPLNPIPFPQDHLYFKGMSHIKEIHYYGNSCIG